MRPRCLHSAHPILFSPHFSPFSLSPISLSRCFGKQGARKIPATHPASVEARKKYSEEKNTTIVEEMNLFSLWFIVVLRRFYTLCIPHLQSNAPNYILRHGYEPFSLQIRLLYIVNVDIYNSVDFCWLDGWLVGVSSTSSSLCSFCNVFGFSHWVQSYFIPRDVQHDVRAWFLHAILYVLEQHFP